MAVGSGTERWPSDDDDDEGDDGGGSPEVANPLTLPSGSITYEIYKWGNDCERSARPNAHSRAQSLSACEPAASEAEWDLPLSHAEMSRPGGFRRHYIHQQAESDGRSANITASFVDFVALYGHFAGGDFPSDEDDDSDEDGGGGGSGARARVAAGAEAEAEAGGARKASTSKTLFLLLKSFVGSGVLFLPRAFYNGGLAFSAAVMVGVACAALFTMLQLVRCYERMHCGYGEMARRLYGRWMERAVLLSVVLSQLGFSCAGAIFVAANMRDLSNAATGCRWRLSLGFWVVVQMAVLAPLCLVRHIKGLSGVALLADAFIVAGLAYVWAVDAATIGRLGTSYTRNFNPEGYALFLGTAAYTFEGYALILPIVDAMERPEKFPLALSLVMAICGAVAVSIGGLSYAAFGDKTQANVLLNMPSRAPATLTVQLLYSLAILFTTPLMMFPVVRILEQALFPRRSGKRSPAVKTQKNVFRMLLLAAVMAVSVVGVERLDKLVAIIGGAACVPLSFVYPPLLHLRAAAETGRQRLRDGLAAGLGAAVSAYVAYGAASRWGAGEPPYDFCDAH
ncbi:hypothetical protein H4R18_002439 [Coemansia javaensis]|uniref:Amino acid transporter transmembrane domain-containing protein n=1 Tax=Coemansia javaensis TaxID=2761396 RepID=A0A9W8HEM3_9FUNG|nr:hypothetical protein H4R18_002439 [Coemansia javaensis]